MTCEEVVAQILGRDPTAPDLPVDLEALLERVEYTYIEAALRQTGGNRKEAAALLGLKRTTLVEKLRRRAARLLAPHAAAGRTVALLAIIAATFALGAACARTWAPPGAAAPTPGATMLARSR